MKLYKFSKKAIKDNLPFLIVAVLASMATTIGVSLGLNLWLSMALLALIIGYSWGTTDI